MQRVRHFRRYGIIAARERFTHYRKRRVIIGMDRIVDDTWMKHTLAWVDNQGNVELDYRPVNLETLTDEVETVPPKARVY